MPNDEAPQRGSTPTTDDETPAGAIVTGPHAWINWYCERVGMPRRQEQHPDAVVLRPIWEEFALYADYRDTAPRRGRRTAHAIE